MYSEVKISTFKLYDRELCIYSPKHVYMLLLLEGISLEKHYEAMMRLRVRQTVKQKTNKRRKRHKRKLYLFQFDELANPFSSNSYGI